MNDKPSEFIDATTRRRCIFETVVSLALFTIAGSILGVAAGYQFRGSFGHVLIVAIAVVCSAVFMCTSLILYLFTAIRRQVALLRSSNIAAGTMLLLAMQAPGYMYGQSLLRGDIQSAKVFCEQLITPLDRYFQQHGSYPNDISVILPTNTKIPPLLGDNFYSSNGKSFNLGFNDPGAMMGGYEYYSNDRRWEYWD